MACCGSRVHDEVCEHKRRSCTDSFCLSFFVIFWIFLAIIAAFAFVVGDPLRIIKGTDSFGNVCGRKNEPRSDLSFSGFDLSDRPYVFFLNAHNLTNTLSICVKTCPDRLLENNGDLLLFYQQTNSSLCRYDFPPDSLNDRPINSYAEYPANLYERLRHDTEAGVGPCPTFPVYESKVVLNRCVPKNIYALGKGVVNSAYNYLNSFDPFRQIVSDLAVSWEEVLIMSGLSVIITFVVVFLIHFTANLVAWVLLIVVSVAMTILTAVFWWTYIDLKYQLTSDLNKFAAVLDEKYRNEKTFLILSIVVTVVTIILVLICLVMRKRVKLVVALFNEAAACIRAMPGLLIQPLWTFIVMCATILFFFALFLAIATADYGMKNQTRISVHARRPSSDGDLRSWGQPDIDTLVSVKYINPSWVRYMWWYAIIAFLWSIEFILGCQQIVIAGAVGSWYFCRDRSNLPCPVGRSIRRLICYHMGSVALGSFLITLLKIPRIILAFVEEKLKQYEEYALVRGCLYCCSCCLWLLENFLQYLNRNAYTVTAIKGTSFCTSASIAFSTIASNALRVAAINSVGDFILFLGKVTVTAITAIATTLLLKVRQKDYILSQSQLTVNIALQSNESLHFYAVPVILTSLIAFFIAHCILSVYEVSKLSPFNSALHRYFDFHFSHPHPLLFDP